MGNVNHVSFWASGRPVPKGSMRGVPLKGGRVILRPEKTQEKALKRWTQTVAWEGRVAWANRRLLDKETPVALDLVFVFARPRTVTRPYPTRTSIGDGDKLTRAVFDALSRVVYEDDAQVTRASFQCLYAPYKAYRGEGVEVFVSWGESSQLT